MKYPNIREEEIKIRVAQDYFWLFDCANKIGNVDFCVCMPKANKGINPLVEFSLAETQSLLWAEAKRDSSDITKSFIQLILTIGKARTFDKYLPPQFLGAFDGEKIAFIPYSEIHDIFYLNDFNWNVTPSNHETKEFRLLREIVGARLIAPLQFNYINDETELKRFIKLNFADKNFGLTKIKIDKNNFITIYNKWLDTVKPTIQVDDWEVAKKSGIIDGDFYLADLLSGENITLKEKLYVLLKSDHYVLDRKFDESGFRNFKATAFSDNQKAHTQFWNKYERPPLIEYWDYIVDHRHLLVPQDIRERKGSFYTPRIWVELSQKYLADVLGENWQEEYYVWDCAAGTGNLLVGLTNKYNIWASTLDKADVDVMKDRIENGANLLEDHVFQFDFLNDDFSKLPQGLQKIINDEKKRKKLVIYINPPYAEVSSIGIKGKAGVNISKIHDKYSKMIGTAGRELYILFLVRIYDQLNGCKIAEFSKLKSLQGSAFVEFRDFFKARLLHSFVVSSSSFDNVTGYFPIGFKIWDTEKQIQFKSIISDVFDLKGNKVGNKIFSSIEKNKYINKWISEFKVTSDYIGFIAGTNGNDIQQNRIVYILNLKEQMANPRGIWISAKNLIQVSIYYAVRKCIKATWLNDRDQFLYPNDGWKTDYEFQNDCLVYTLFNNNIQSKHGTNHWIPFTEYVVSARDKFDSHFMTNFIKGDTNMEWMVEEPLLFYADREFGGGAGRGGFPTRPTKREFSETAKLVFQSGQKLWKYYHTQKFEGGQTTYNVNASLYDIREHFQGRNEKGTMNPTSNDEKYNELIENLRLSLKTLSKKIEPKIYEYGFLFN